MAHKSLEVGDKVFVLMGVDCPFVLQGQGDNRYAVVAEAHVWGMMDGGLLEEATAAYRAKHEDQRAAAIESNSDWVSELSGLTWQQLPFETAEIVLVKFSASAKCLSEMAMSRRL
jgi:hypothetical protein